MNRLSTTPAAGGGAMSCCVGLLLMATYPMTGAAAAEGDTVVERIKDHFARIRSVRVVATERAVLSGGLYADDPAREKVEYKTHDVRNNEYEVWLGPPKFRSLWTEVRFDAAGQATRASTESYYDGHVFTGFNIRHSGFEVEGGSHVRPHRTTPLQAIGFVFPETLGTSLGDLLDAASKVAVRQSGPIAGWTVWELEVEPLPDAIRPRDWSDKGRSITRVKIWVSVEPEVVVHRWAVYMHGPMYVPADGPTKLEKKPLPVFELDGYHVHYCFANFDLQPTRDEMRNRTVLMPRRVLHGNAVGVMEVAVKQLQINPPEPPGAFRPAMPPGQHIQKIDAGGASQQTVSGPNGQAVRVKEISQEARDLLASGDGLGASAGFLSGWGVPGLGAALAMAGAVVGVLAWKRRNAP